MPLKTRTSRGARNLVDEPGRSGVVLPSNVVCGRRVKSKVKNDSFQNLPGRFPLESSGESFTSCASRRLGSVFRLTLTPAGEGAEGAPGVSFLTDSTPPERDLRSPLSCPTPTAPLSVTVCTKSLGTQLPCNRTWWGPSSRATAPGTPAPHLSSVQQASGRTNTSIPAGPKGSKEKL